MAFLVILWYPGLGEIAGLRDGVEHVGIEHFLTIASIEALNKGVLIGLSRLDEPKFNLSSLTPLGESNRRKYAAVV